MTRWRELPASLDPRARQLVVQLRRLKDHSGLGLAALGARTAYSKSSWERYLNGKALPPRQAVVDLARVAAADTTRLLALHEVAQSVPGAEPVAGPDEGLVAAPQEGPPDGADTVPGAGAAERQAVWSRMPFLPTVLIAVLSAAVGAAAGWLLAAQPWEEAGRATGTAVITSPASHADRVWAHEDGPFVFEPGASHPCEVKREDGKLYAGHSGTQSAVLVYTSGSWDVVEAQCLLKERGFPPGVVDGAFGEKTERAVLRLQREAGLVEDGRIGEHTWRELRR